jgi:hypothetical protein
LLRAQIQVTDNQGVLRTYDGTGALFIAFERKFNVSILELGESPRLEHIYWLGYEAARRQNQHDQLDFDQWLDAGYSVEFEADDTPLAEDHTPTS